MLAPPPFRLRPDPRRRRLLRLYDRLRGRYGAARRSPTRSRLEQVVEAIVGQNPTGRNAERRLARLRAVGARDPAAILTSSPPRLAALLSPPVTARVTARRLRAFARHVMRRHGGRLARFLALPLPALRHELGRIVRFPPGTVDAVLLHAAGRPIFVADAPARRILARHRLVSPRADYAEVQALAMSLLPHDPALFAEFHALLGRVAAAHCRAQPRCERCPLRFDLRGRPPAARLPRRPVEPRRRDSGAD